MPIYSLLPPYRLARRTDSLRAGFLLTRCLHVRLAAPARRLQISQPGRPRLRLKLVEFARPYGGHSLGSGNAKKESRHDANAMCQRGGSCHSHRCACGSRDQGAYLPGMTITSRMHG